MDTATNFTFSNDAHINSNSAFHFNNINLNDNSNLKSKMNNDVSNFSFTLNSNLSKENSINNSNSISMYGNFNNMKGNSKPSPFLQWRNKQKQKKPRYFRNDINIESDEEEEEEEEDDDDEETSSIPEIFKFEDSASFGRQNSSSSRLMSNSSKLTQDYNKNSFLFNNLEGKNKDIRSSSTPNINAFFNKNINRENGHMSDNVEIGELNRIYSLSNLNSINNENSKSVKGSHPLLNCLNSSRSTSSLNSTSAITNNSTNNTISSYAPMQTDNKSPLSISSKLATSKPITIPFGSSGSLHSREDDIQMDDVFSNNNQKSLGCNSLLAKMQLDVDNNTSKNKNDTQKFSKKVHINIDLKILHI